MKSTKNTKVPAAKLDLEGLGTPAPSSTVEYPVLPDRKGDLAYIAIEIGTDRLEIKDLQKEVEANCAQLTEVAVPFYFKQTNGRREPLTGVAVEADVEVDYGKSERKTMALVLVANKYGLITDDTKKKVKADVVKQNIVAITGTDFFKQHFEEVALVAVSIDKVPKNRQQAFIDALRELVQGYKVTDAVTVKHGFQAKDTFHSARHTELSATENIELQGIYPAQVTVKTGKLA